MMHGTINIKFVPVAVDTAKNCTPDDGCVKHPKHVEWTLQWLHIAASVGYFIEYVAVHLEWNA